MPERNQGGELSGLDRRIAPPLSVFAKQLQLRGKTLTDLDRYDPQGSAADFFSLTARDTALLIIDLQNAFLDVDAAPGYGIGNAVQILPHLEKLLAVTRPLGVPVVWTKSDHRPPFGGVILRKFPAIRDNRVLWAGDRTAELYESMPQPQATDFIVTKHKYDAFFETDLDAILRNLRVTTLLVAGVGTNVCVDSTARSAFSRDYQVALLKDCTASFDDAAHQAALKVFRLFFGRVVDSEQAIAELIRSRSDGAEIPAVLG